MFTTVLMDEVHNTPESNSHLGGRIPKCDEETLAVLSEEAILFYIAYLDKIKVLFTSCHHINKMDNDKSINWKELSDKNLGILTGSFLYFCCEYYLIPHMFNVEALQQILMSVVPPLHKEEYEYYNNSRLVTQYEDDRKKISTFYEFVDGEPMILLHEFMFVLGKIAYTAVTVPDAETLSDKIKVFFIEKLGFPAIDDVEEHVQKYLMGEFEREKDTYSSDEELEAEYVNDPHQVLLDFIERRSNRHEEMIDYEKVLKDLDTSLPQIPQKPKIEQANPPPYAIPRENFGKKLPKPEDEGKDKKKKPQPKRKPPKK
jgi:hypothetical protein